MVVGLTADEVLGMELKADEALGFNGRPLLEVFGLEETSTNNVVGSPEPNIGPEVVLALGSGSGSTGPHVALAMGSASAGPSLSGSGETGLMSAVG